MRDLFQEIMEQVHGPAWEPARRSSAVRPRRPPRASYVAGARSGGSRSQPDVRSGGPRGQPGVDHRTQRGAPVGAAAVEAPAVLSEREADVEDDGYGEPVFNPFEGFEAGD